VSAGGNAVPGDIAIREFWHEMGAIVATRGGRLTIVFTPVITSITTNTELNGNVSRN